MPVPKGTRIGGRQKGTPNKNTEQRTAAMQDAARIIEAAMPDAFKGDSHALLMAVYKDINNPMAMRVDAAKAAIGYEKPRLASIESTVSLKHDVDDYSTEELVAIATGSGPMGAETDSGSKKPH